MRLTLRTLLAYLDDTLPPDQAKTIGQKVAESETARDLIDRIKKVTRRRGLSTPTADMGPAADPNTVADYLSDALSAEQLAQFEKACLDSDVLLAEAAACHQILTLLLSEPVRVPPTARQRMYHLVRGRESIPNRKPGGTVPVAGELPAAAPDDPDEADAPFLLGMRAYSRSEPWRRRAVPLAAAIGTAVVLCLTVWLALPTSRRTAEPIDDRIALGPTPGLPPVQPGKAIDSKRGPEPGPKPPPKDDEKTVPMAPAKGEDKPTPPTTPAETPARELVPAAAKPKQERAVAGQVENPDAAVVVARAGAEGKWLRATAKESDVFTTDRIVALPGYKAKVRVDPATEVELWANVPEQQPLIPVLETAVTFYLPDAGIDADLAVHAGRVYVAAKRPTGVRVRLRFREEVWDLTLPDDKTEVVAEVVNTLVPGVTRDVDPSELPRVSVVLAVLKGTAGLKVRYKDLPKIAANEAVEWSSKGPGLEGPVKLNTQGARSSAYYSRYELPVGDDARAAQEALADLSRRAAERDSILIAFTELLREDPNWTPSRVVGAKLAVYGHATLGDLSPVIDALNDGGRFFVRWAAVYALSATLAESPDGVEQFRRRLIDKLGLKPEQVSTTVRLLRGMSDAERRDPGALDQLIAALSADALVVRELAHTALRYLADPNNQPARTAQMYDAAAPPEAREDGVKAWRKYVEELKKKAADTTPPEKK